MSQTLLIPVSEAAKLAQYSTRHIRLLLDRGLIRGRKIGRNWVTTREAVNDYLQTKPQPGPRPQPKKIS
ncbi:MAG: helix-turn-helix domain-containing protein [Anaerolineales bacterium]|nr:helix-turn-helix domain-containing protein [Anaerolineales bacterium]